LRAAIQPAVWVALPLAFAARAPSATAQWTVRGSGIAAVMQHRVDAGYGIEPSNGVVAGGEVSLGAGNRVAIRLQTQSGTLHADAPGAIDRDLAEVGGEVEVVTLHWLAVQAGIRQRTYSTILARQRWTMVNVGAEARLPFSETGVNGIVRGAIMPSVSVNGLGAPNLAFAVASGMDYRTGRASVAVLYSLERYRFPARAMVERREQISALLLRAGWSLTL